MAVKLKMLSLSAALCLSIFTMARPGMAQVEELEPQPPLVRQMLQEGWTQVADGVLQRTAEGGQTETFTYGEDGLRWTARRLEARLEFLQNEYNARPSEDLSRLIGDLKTQLIGLDQNLKNGTAQAEVASPDTLTDCTIQYGAHASTFPLTGSQAPGVGASADANYSSNCGQYGNTYAYAYARATLGTVTTVKIQEDPQYDYITRNSAASATAPGDHDCYSEAYARAWSPTLNINYEVSPAPNYSCPNPPPPINAWIDGPSEVYFDDYYTQCSYLTWYGNATGGTPGYTFYWYINGAYYGSGSSLTQYYCQTNGRLDVRADVYDSGGQSTSAYFTTWLYYTSSCSSNCGCYPYAQSEPSGSTTQREICPYYDQP
jgi:hypothetical protein